MRTARHNKSRHKLLSLFVCVTYLFAGHLAQDDAPTTTPPPSFGSLPQLLDGKYYTIRSFFNNGCLELCNPNVTDCSAPYMLPSYFSQVFVNPKCHGGPGQLWRAVPTVADNGLLTAWLVNKMQGFCLNRCFGGGCGYRNNLVAYNGCFLNSYDQAFYFNGTQIMFSRQQSGLPPNACVSACYPGSTLGQCDYPPVNYITPYNAEAQTCNLLATQNWFVQ